jgi:hypothetical protein
MRSYLYDLQLDLGGRRPIRDRPEQLASLSERLERWWQEAGCVTSSPGRLDPGTTEPLRDLGYLR